MAKVLGMVHMHRRVLLQGRWRSIGLKLVVEQIDQMAAPVPEMMDTYF
jgi:hypothetical protein